MNDCLPLASAIGFSSAGRSLEYHNNPPDKKRSSHARKLTLRQCDILQGILDGESNKAIARRLGISHNTVRNYSSQIYKIFDQPDRASLRRLFDGSHELPSAGEPTGGYTGSASGPFSRFKTEGAERDQIFVVTVRSRDIANADFLKGPIMLIVGGVVIPAVHVNRAEFLKDVGGEFDLCLD